MTTDERGAIEVRNAGGGNDELRDPLLGLVVAAIRAGASDIHIDPVPDGYRIRLRVDGVVHLHDLIDETEGHRLLNQAKVAAQMELEHAHHPMEGQFDYHDGHGHRRDIRATIVPTLVHEAAHLRMLTLPDSWRGIADIGLAPEELKQVESVVESPQGLVLVAGATGSGKTTTQYALARALDLENYIAVSIEDPIEVDLPNLRQMEVDDSRGFQMADGLRVLLRMDPDVMLVGEVRDRSSAVTAAHAALGGRMVLATVHARDAAAAIDAMHFRSVPFYILSGALRMVIVQNLVRVLCPECSELRPITERERGTFEEFDLEAPEQLRHPVGCQACARGYYGRTGVFEVVTIDEEMADFLAQGPHQREIRKRFRETGSRPLIVGALQKVADHETSFEEVIRLHSRHLDLVDDNDNGHGNGNGGR